MNHAIIIQLYRRSVTMSLLALFATLVTMVNPHTIIFIKFFDKRAFKAADKGPDREAWFETNLAGADINISNDNIKVSAALIHIIGVSFIIIVRVVIMRNTR